ncbi:hypothetical protein IB279_25560 [Ensifer sp. ENS06]|uniref:hypothetical protein n=1 Tax=Ensifer sp. ENS06 TaxID=2769276 RepID=UPI000DDCC4CE|nr:hypothetical protein [Ensifer sp. ENS06]MBD9626320.1 hypothetical protein [Ensifer sp. ENS06]
MKSPWKYLVQLASRGRTIKEPESPRELEADKPAAEVAEPIAEASNEGSGDLQTATTNTVVVAVAGSATPSTMIDRSGAEDQALLTEQARPSQPMMAKGKARKRKTNTSEVAVTDVVEYEGGGSGVPPPPMTFFDEMTALDEEIRQLRYRLAEKLLLQNTQLKKMLERFDA